MHTPLVALVARGLADHGFATLRYNFPFAEAGRRRPDFPRTLQATTVAAARLALETLGDIPLVLGGKSLGGRMSSHVVADASVDAAGLLLLGYPLHPPRRPEELRDAHLPRITCPMLFVEGTRDPYAQPSLLTRMIRRLTDAGKRVALHVIDGGDHDLKVPLSRRRPYEEVVSEVVGAIGSWARDSVG